MSESYLVIELNQQPVELCKLLKIANLVSGGGEAKIVISEGYVLLNGDVEYQKRKKIYHNDVIEFNGEVIQLQINEALTQVIDDAIDENIEVASAKEIEQKTNKPQGITSETTRSQKKANAKQKPTKQAKDNFTEKVPESDAVKMPKKRRPISF
ncbi:RNA-binding S4 domain-containing protein [Colwellia ponticola]|uniref:RNA-binding S4 domain-containing protein n=1 Tax=Colwellia ponticola TaxID=2304625 RepID=A0A8H2JLZ4_9GAMM|nr:RNA-binding S4 domain-containing protein [Colwellia ponticola]TMM41891.1 RNA-binding S4 domain-containing protein [Colwellia ponticola]